MSGLSMDEIENGLKSLLRRPHVVILGAGASVAAIPNGDKHGRKISVMSGFIDRLGMRDILSGTNVKSENLEDVYSELSEHSEYAEQRLQLEDTIREYFTHLRLPDKPTIYDLLLLSLKEKDVVASFNWDPLLMQAFLRCQRITEKLPRILFLHGNVALRLCMMDKNIYPAHYEVCPICKDKLVPSRLLYPIKHKNYNNDPFIRDQWRILLEYLKVAYIVTIFGYSAPKTDVEAIQLFKNAWGDNQKRLFEQIEIIDIKSHDSLVKKWEDFIYVDHVQTVTSFGESILARSPRRTTEDLYLEHIKGEWFDYDNQLTLDMDWSQLKSHFEKILREEENFQLEGNAK